MPYKYIHMYPYKTIQIYMYITTTIAALNSSSLQNTDTLQTHAQLMVSTSDENIEKYLISNTLHTWHEYLCSRGCPLGEM